MSESASLSVDAATLLEGSLAASLARLDSTPSKGVACALAIRCARYRECLLMQHARSCTGHHRLLVHGPRKLLRNQALSPAIGDHGRSRPQHNKLPGKQSASAQSAESVAKSPCRRPLPPTPRLQPCDSEEHRMHRNRLQPGSHNIKTAPAARGGRTRAADRLGRGEAAQHQLNWSSLPSSRG